MADDWGLAVPFLSDSPEYAAGVRLGMLYAYVSRLPARKRKYVEVLPETDEEQIRLLMHRLGWGVARRQACGESPSWLIVTFRRRPDAVPG